MVAWRGIAALLIAGGGAAEPRYDGSAREGAVVLGAGRAPDGTRVKLLAHDGRCITIRGLPGGDRACGVAPSEREPRPRSALTGAAVVRLSRNASIELHGEAGAAVRRVEVRYRHGGCPHRRRASLIEARDLRGLDATGIDEPFSSFIALVPPGARRIVAEASDGTRRVGSLRFDPIVRSMHPRVFIARPTPPRTPR
jgi:hypothetical protein